MNEAQALGWLGRKIAWGLTPAMQEEWLALGVDGVIDRLVEPDAHGIAARIDPFVGIPVERGNAGASIREGIVNWLGALIDTPRPLESFMEFFWSDYFAVSIRSVRPVNLMFDHMNLLGRHSLGNFRTLLHDITIDGAMLDFLDGGSNRVGNPNENYGRELLELYSVGVGHFTEADVKAAAVALTGWQLQRRRGTVRFVDRFHDDTAQTVLGVDDVHDVDTVIDAVVTHPATAERVVDKLAVAILGPGYDTARTASLAASFADDLELKPVVRGLLELGVDGAAMPAIIEPLPWMITAHRFTGAPLAQGPLRTYFRTSGQTPLFPPNVGGFPDPDAYLSSSATIARFNLAAAMSTRARAEARQASRDVDDLAHALNLSDGFRAATRDAIGGLTPGPDRITAALASPDVLVV
ncbi:MAG: DUF1800 family protein [Actinomycetota bacterium]